MRTATWLLLIGVGFGYGSSQAEAQLLERLERGLDRLTAPGPSGNDALPSPDDAQRPTLGLSTHEEGEPGGGVLIDSIVPNGPASRAGLRAGDLITRANGKPVSSANDLGGILSGAKVGDRASLTVRSAGRDRVVELAFAARTGDGTAASSPMPLTPPTEGNLPLTPADPPAFERPTLPLPGRDPALEATPEAAGRPTLGVSVAPLTEEAATRYGVPTRRGGLIAKVTPEGPADRAGIPVGAVVVAIDTVRIDTADQLVDAIRTSRAGQEIELSYYNGPTMTRKTIRLGSAGPAPAGIGEPSPRFNRIDLSPPAADPLATRSLASAADSGEVAALRAEVQQLRDQLRELQERLDRLEKAPAASAPGDGGPPAGRFGSEDGGAAASPPRFAPPSP